MKRSEMINIIENHFDDVCYVDYAPDAEAVLSLLEKQGMKPPCLDGDKCQKLMRKYIDPNFNMWDEEYDKIIF